METVKIDMPETKITFEIAGKNYVLDLTDTTRGKINEKYNHVTLETLKTAQSQKLKGAEFTDKLSELDIKMAEEDIPETKQQQQRYTLQNKFERQMQNMATNQEAKEQKMSIELLDIMFGAGSGNKIYLDCNQSTPILGQVLSAVILEMQTRTNVVDYVDNYRKKIEGLKNEVQPTE